MTDVKNNDIPASFVFLHITKCGGSTLKKIIRNQYEESEYYIMRPPFDQSIRNKFIALPESEKMKLKVLMGHNTHALAPYMPQPCIYYTMFRNPVDRAISYYYYASKTPTNKFHEQIKKGMTLVEFDRELSNRQSKAVGNLTGHKYTEIEKIKELLRNNTIRFGLMERYDESMLLLAEMLGWKDPPYYKKLNVTMERPKTRAVPEEDIKLIKEINSKDIELYDYAVELFEEKLDKLGKSFKRKTKKFTKKNLARSKQKPRSIFNRVITGIR